MFNSRYFPAFYFAPRYWPEAGANSTAGYLSLLVTGEGYVVLQTT